VWNQAFSVSGSGKPVIRAALAAKGLAPWAGQ